ncbi:sortase [Candidatus Kaiserbacteria bacterium]|nr:sortase [Candidatus Kaiserbacteria bacterium]
MNRPPAAVFVASTIVIFFLSLSAADSIGFVPYYVDGSSPASVLATSEQVALSDLPMLGDEASSQQPAAMEATLPVRLKIPAINLDLAVQNPSTIDIDKLDALLVNGPARYADSAKLGESGNIILFAHSSHLPIVHNQMYKAFNRIPELKSGDTITLVGYDGKSYLYSVESLVKADVSDTSIDLSIDTTKLTLVTCDTLKGKSARYVLTAYFVGVL